MVFVEFYDKNQIENVVTALFASPRDEGADPLVDAVPEGVYLFGDGWTVKEACERYRRIFTQRGKDIPFYPVSADRNRIETIISSLSKIVAEHEYIAIDVTGGDELFLVAAGVVTERYPEKHVQLHRFSIASDAIKDIDLDGRTLRIAEHAPLSVEENVSVYGGRVLYDTQNANGTVLWEADVNLISQVNTMWEIMREDDRGIKAWNRTFSVFEAAAHSALPETDPKRLVSPKAAIRSYLASIDLDLDPDRDIDWFLIKKLISAGLITDVSYGKNDDGDLNVAFSNARVKKILTKAGALLEMKIFVTAAALTEKTGRGTALKPVYDDVKTGVYIDWDGEAEGELSGTGNEIDLILMHGLVPVFISCKNGAVSSDELYKFKTVADRFGGKYVKKWLFVTALNEKTQKAKAFLERAADMGVKVVTNLAGMKEDQLKTTLSNLWR